MVETEAVMEKMYRVAVERAGMEKMEIPPDPPFSKGGNVLLFSGTCRHAAEDSLRIPLIRMGATKMSRAKTQRRKEIFLFLP
jgi:hypothetical protein